MDEGFDDSDGFATFCGVDKFDDTDAEHNAFDESDVIDDDRSDVGNDDLAFVEVVTDATVSTVDNADADALDTTGESDDITPGPTTFNVVDLHPIVSVDVVAGEDVAIDSGDVAIVVT